ncbi:uncharacterized protein LOC107321290 isoform X2 [Coturnix japonica]|uniref:uncharacterized protein LOC107321290 isoform X2 n=1 Tax=Coturnix japonica TaxID=93934 RepID=UPI0013A5D67D|nr:uncharacterized protein LOC107321290 isoform X2 [Coturnix japonica]
MALTSCVLLTFLTLLLPWGSETLKSQVVLVAVGEPVSMECSFRKDNSTRNPFYEILWSHGDESKRVQQFRMTRSNQSCVSESAGHFSSVLDFGRSVSFLNISAVLMNDTGPYLCYVKIGNSSPTKKVIHLLVIGESGSLSFFQHCIFASLRTCGPLWSLSGFTTPLGSTGTVGLSSVDKGLGCLHELLFFADQQPWAAPGDLSYSAPQGSEVTLDCDFPTDLTGNFTELFWLHKRDQSPPRLIAWHLSSSFQDENGSIGSRFQCSLDVKNQQSHLTITGLEEKDSGWYQCQGGLGDLPGRQRGRGTNLTVKGSSSVLLVFLMSAMFAVIAPCLYFLYRCRVQLRRHNTLADRLHPHCGPSETTGRETTSREAIYVSPGSVQYSFLTFPGRNPAVEDVGQR